MFRRPLVDLVRVVFTVTLLAAATPHATHGQPLIDHVPADAVAYFGWAGTDSLEGAYAQSTLREAVELIDTEKLYAAWRSAMPTIRQQLDDPEFPQFSKHLSELWAVSMRGAMAAYVTLPQPGGVEQPDGLLGDITAIGPFEGDDLAGGDAPVATQPGLVLLWQPVTGDDRKDLLDGIKYYQSKSPRETQLVVDGPVVSLYINRPPNDRPAAAEIDPGDTAKLVDTPRFTETISQLESPGPLVFYADLASVIDQVKNGLRGTATVQEHDGPALEASSDHPALAFFEPLGLDNLGPLAATAGFDGKRWRTQLHLAVPAPRVGIAALLDAPALSADDLAKAPIDSPWTAALSFDAGLLMDLVRDGFNAAGADAADQFEQGLAAASGIVGIDVENQLIRGFGSTWSLYLNPDAAGASMLGLTLVNPLLDAEGVERGLRSVQMFGNLAFAQQMSEEDFRVQIHTQTYDGVDLHTLGTPLLSPTWAIVDGKLVVGLTPQTVLAAVDRVDEGDSLAQQDDFAALREAIGTRRLTALTWVDLRRTAPTSYQNFLMIESLLTGGGSMATGLPMPMVLPPLNRLKPMLEPAHAIAWVDDAGWHYDSQMPFPGSTLLAPGATGGVFVAPTAAGILLPALGAARRTARQMTDNTQARGIHQAMVNYAIQNDERMPDDIGLLIEAGFFSPDYTISEASQTIIPNGINTWPLEQQADWVRQNSDYIIVPGLEFDLAADKIALFMVPGIYNDPGTPGRGSIARNDNSTSFEVDYPLFEVQLLEQTGMTMQQLIDRQRALANR
ncbi:MAG: hypothetical protein AAGH99_09850 [Planctomycetota bacterium]